MDICCRGDFGEGKIADRAPVRRWAAHRAAMRGTRLAWRQNGVVRLERRVAKPRPGGHLGIRPRSERATRCDDVKITVLD